MKKTFLLATTIFCFLNIINAQAGRLDTSFGNEGVVKTYVGDSLNIYKKTAIQKDAKVVVAGSTWNGSDLEMVIIRYTINGSLDGTFSDDGILRTGFTSSSEHRKDVSIAIQNDGKIVAADAATHILARYNTDGTPDNTFSTDGKQITDINIYSETIQNDGKILVTGTEKVDDYNYNPVIARYNTDGSPDKTFGADGKKTLVLDIYDVTKVGYFSSIVVQKDGKIVLTGIFGRYAYIVAIRLNTDGSLDQTFNHSGIVFPDGLATSSFSTLLQDDGKIVIARSSNYEGRHATSVVRYNSDGSIDNSFKAKENFQDTTYTENTSAALQSDGKIIVASSALLRFNTNGSLDSTFNVNTGGTADFIISDVAVDDNKLYTVGNDSGETYGFVARYLLDDNSNTLLTITLTTPANNATYLAPAARIRFSAVAAAKDGAISKVEFYNGTTLLHTETVAPYGFVWRNVSLGNYTITAKAYDNSGNIATSAPVHISVVPNKPPTVSIIKPSNNQSFAAPGYIHITANAKDADGRIARVEFYNGPTLLRTEYNAPYTYNWQNVPAGTYTITAVAVDNWAASTISEPVTIRVTSSNTIVNSRSSENNKKALNNTLSLKLSPNPATSIVNIYTAGLQQSRPATILIMSASGNVLKKFEINNSTTQLDVSSLTSGVYTIKIVSGEKVMYKQFVKL